MIWSPGPDIEARLVTEDGSAGAHDTLAHLVRRMLLLIEPSFATNRLKAHRVEGSEERTAAQPHRWASKNEKDRVLIKKLARMIATDLLASRFVFLHADADVPWSERPSHNAASFEDNLRVLIRSALAEENDAPKRPGPRRPVQLRSTNVIDRLIARLVLLMPYRTIESWLYQNDTAGIRICQEKYQGKDIQKLREWAANRTLLDDAELDELRAVCLQKKHNVDLASSGYPAAEVHAAKTSFHAAVNALEACADLHAALTAQGVSPPPT